ncbi:MAG: nuclear transport factor 2 family protein [Conexivisphaerales archaeon]
MPKSTSVRSNISDDTKVFEKLVNGVIKGWASQDPAKAAPYYSKDRNLVFFDFAPLKYTGWKEYAEGVQKLFFDNMPPHSSGFKSISVLKVKKANKLAVTLATFHFWAKMKDGTKIESDGRITTVWEKKENKWLIVHDHWSFPFSPK